MYMHTNVQSNCTRNSQVPIRHTVNIGQELQRHNQDSKIHTRKNAVTLCPEHCKSLKTLTYLGMSLRLIECFLKFHIT
jgi:hypothetical protein